MVSAQITGMSLNAYGQSGNVQTKSKNSKMDFNSLMSSTLAGHQDFTKIQTEIKPEKVNAGKTQTNDIKAKSPQEPDNSVKSEDTIKAEPKENAKDAVKTEQDKPEETTQTDVRDDVQEVSDEVIQQIREKLKEKFGISDEELEAILSQLSMTVSDLTDVSKLTGFVAAAMGEENTFAAITNEELLKNVYEISDFINEQQNFESVESKDVVPVMQNESTVAQEMPVKVNEEAVDLNEASENENANVKSDDFTAKIEIVSAKEDGAQLQEQHGSNSEAGKDTSDKSGIHSRMETATAVASQLTQSIEQTFTQALSDSAEAVENTQIVRQIIDAVKVFNGNEFSSMEIALNPQHLGRLNLTVAAKQGVVTAQFVAENETVKRAIEAQLSVLKANFEQQGIKVEAIEVTVASHGFDANAGFEKGNSQQQGNSRSKKNGLRPDILEELNEEDGSQNDHIRQIMQDNSSVEFKA